MGKVSTCKAWKHNPGSANTLCCTVCVMVIDVDMVHRYHGHHLCALCVVVVGVACGVAVAVFAHVVWGRCRHRCSMCVAVMVFVPCVVVAGAVYGVMVMVTVFTHMVWGRCRH